MLVDEIKEFNKEGKEFDIAESINAQLPFFSCKNSVYDKGIQRDIQRYLYCNEVNIPPYEGAYDKQPALWVDRYFIIKKSFAKREKSQISKANKNQ